MKVQGSEALLKSLIKEEVDTVFGYPGGAIMPIYDALYGYMDKINHILTRHEQGAILLLKVIQEFQEKLVFVLRLPDLVQQIL